MHYWAILSNQYTLYCLSLSMFHATWHQIPSCIVRCHPPHKMQMTAGVISIAVDDAERRPWIRRMNRTTEKSLAGTGEGLLGFRDIGFRGSRVGVHWLSNRNKIV